MRFDPQSQEPDGEPCLIFDILYIFLSSQKLFGDKGRANMKEKKILSLNDQTECVKLSARL